MTDLLKVRADGHPSLFSAGPHQENKFSVHGGDYQVLSMQLDPEEKIYLEPGTMLSMDPGVTTGCSCDPYNGCLRCCAGEHCQLMTYTNTDPTSKVVHATSVFPNAKIVDINFEHFPEWNFKQGAFMGSSGKVKITPKFAGCQACCCGDQNCLVLNLKKHRKQRGDNSRAFISAGGTIVYRPMQAGENFMADGLNVVGWTKGIEYSITRFATNGFGGFLCQCCCGGEGMFSAYLKAKEDGVVILQSLPFEKFRKAIQPVGQGNASSTGGSTQNAGAPLEEEMRR
eukprot:g3056.t1